ncbi:MAG: TRAM domain-containing protein [Candidatus Aenigmatarchaeota archaeon]|nr:TRAM domain-containing protein [Candidatus Aenigmarchaeota archaeon]
MLGRKDFGQKLRYGNFKRKFGFKGEQKLAPVKVGEEYDVEISEISRRGDGIAKVNNFVIFVTGANKGDKGKIKITEVHRRCASGKFINTQEKENNEEQEESYEEESFEEENEEF